MRQYDPRSIIGVGSKNKKKNKVSEEEAQAAMIAWLQSDVEEVKGDDDE